MEDNEFEPIELIMNEVESLPNDKLAMLFLNLIGSDGLIEMVQEIFEGKPMLQSAIDVRSKKDAKKFVKSFF